MAFNTHKTWTSAQVLKCDLVSSLQKNVIPAAVCHTHSSSGNIITLALSGSKHSNRAVNLYFLQNACNAHGNKHESDRNV